MEKNAFLILLDDLYTKYTPNNKKDIEHIAQKYLGQELDAIYSFLVKYNYPKHPQYNPALNDVSVMKHLLKDYSEGNRTINNDSQPSIEERIKSTVVKETESKFVNTTEQLQQEISKFKIELKNEVNDVLNNLKQIDSNNGVIKLNLLYTESELKLTKAIENFNIGTRYLIKDSSNKIVALEIKDVFYDFITNEDRFVKEITIDKF